jgi:hypothetical protein
MGALPAIKVESANHQVGTRTFIPRDKRYKAPLR